MLVQLFSTKSYVIGAMSSSFMRFLLTTINNLDYNLSIDTVLLGTYKEKYMPFVDGR